MKTAGQFLNEQVNDRLKNALGGPDSFVSVSARSPAVEPTAEPSEEPGEVSEETNGDLVTTKDEFEGDLDAESTTPALTV